MGKVDKICQLYLQPVVKTFSLSRIGRTVVKIRQTRLTLCCAARDESERELRIISSVSYSFFFFFKYNREQYYLTSTGSISAAYIIIAWV